MKSSTQSIPREYHYIFGFSIILKEKWEINDNIILLKKLYKSWNNSSFSSNVNVHKKVISYNFVPNIVFYNNGVYSNPFHNNKNTIINTIMTIEKSVIEQKNIEISLKAIHDRKIERERIMELERIEDEKLFSLLKEREIILNNHLNRTYVTEKTCSLCKISPCKCLKIESFFKSI